MPCKRSYGGVVWDASGRLCLLGGLRQGGGHQSSKFTKNVNIFDTNQGTNARLSSLFRFAFTHFLVKVKGQRLKMMLQWFKLTILTMNM